MKIVDINNEYIPVLIGQSDVELSEIISCIDATDKPDRDLFGNIMIKQLHISQIKGFKGSYRLPLFNLNQYAQNTQR